MNLPTVNRRHPLSGLAIAVVSALLGAGIVAWRLRGKSPVRGCDVLTGVGSRPRIWLTTVQEEALTGAFWHTVLELGDHVTSKDEAVEVSGSYSAATAALYGRHRGPVRRVPQGCGRLPRRGPARHRGHTFIRDVFPSYVAAEAERLGCGPLPVRMKS